MDSPQRPRTRYVFKFLRPKPGERVEPSKPRPPEPPPVVRPPKQRYVFWFLRPKKPAVVAPAAEPVSRPVTPPVPEVVPPRAPETEPVPAAEPVAQPEPAVEPEPEPVDFFARIRSGLGKTRDQLVRGLEGLLATGRIDEDLLEELENHLLMADVGVEATTAIVGAVRSRAGAEGITEPEAVRALLRDELSAILRPTEAPLVVDLNRKPYVILVVGVNGAGKTTTIGKLAHYFGLAGHSVLLAAGDTFRAAAVEQLQVWGERNRVPVIAQQAGADSASVIYDAVEAARARGIDVVIADTAGRLHNKDHLMEELRKVARVVGKLDDTAPHEVLLVLDAGTGQNALSQARTFQDAVQVTGIAMTKLDGTARGGILFAVARQLGIPIRFIGVGEAIDDLRPFAADEFVRALFN